MPELIARQFFLLLSNSIHALQLISRIIGSPILKMNLYDFFNDFVLSRHKRKTFLLFLALGSKKVAITFKVNRDVHVLSRSRLLRESSYVCDRFALNRMIGIVLISFTVSLKHFQYFLENKPVFNAFDCVTGHTINSIKVYIIYFRGTDDCLPTVDWLPEAVNESIVIIIQHHHSRSGPLPTHVTCPKNSCAALLLSLL